jgi:membrane-associated phospholipid phosphatase
MLTDYSVRWALLGVCFFVVADWLIALHISLDFGSLVPTLEILCILLIFSALYLGIGNRTPKLQRPLAVTADYCFSLSQFLVVITVMLPMTYLVATTGFPLLDDRLARFDAMLGFDWNGVARWVGERPVIDWVFQHVYFSIRYQAAAILLIGSFRLERNGEFLWLVIISVLITCVIFAFTPALGKVGHLGTRPIDILSEIRRGDWSTMDYNRTEDIINFPSFHTTLAIILTYAVRYYRWALAVFVPLNCLVILSIPTVGGHYLVDLFGGAAVAGLAILLVQFTYRPMRSGVR